MYMVKVEIDWLGRKLELHPFGNGGHRSNEKSKEI